jgi:protein TonB
MFEQLVESRRKKSGKRWAYFGATAAAWVFAMSGVIVAGVVAYEARLSDQLEVIELAPPVLEPLIRKGGAPPNVEERRNEGFVSAEKEPDSIPAPSKLPPVDAPLTDFTAAGPGPENGDPNGPTTGSEIGIIGATPSTAPAPPEPQPEPRRVEPKREEVAAVPLKPIRKSEGPLQGSAINRVEPAYPRLAITAGVTGAVVVEILIDEKGNVASARALSGHALLREAALSAARGWRWKPTTLNGVPVQVIGTITFNFIR